MLKARAYDAAWMTSAPLRRRLRSLADAQRFDLVHVDSVGLAPHARRFRAPIVQNHHNVESAMLRRRADAEPSRWRRAFFRYDATKLTRLERRSARRTALHLAVSEVDGRRLRQIVGDGEIRVVPNGVDTEWFAPERPIGHGDGGLVFAGALDWYPNREAMRFFTGEVWPLLSDDAPARRLAIVGRGAPPDLRRLDGARGITLPGFVDDVRPWLDDASIYVCPIRDGGGTRLKVLDAMAMAKPIVATTLAVEGLGLDEGVHYLRADSPAEWLRQVRRLEADAELRRRIAAAGRALVVRRYDWRSIGRDLVAAYRNALSAAVPVPAPRAETRPATPRCPDATRSGAG
jgi:glycosyltransferase involved in cell wall biosynthesis